MEIQSTPSDISKIIETNTIKILVSQCSVMANNFEELKSDIKK